MDYAARMVDWIVHGRGGLSPRLRHYRMGLWLVVVAVLGLMLGALLPKFLGFWWALTLMLIAGAIMLWFVVRHDDEQGEV